MKREIEHTPPNVHCPHPEWWTAADENATENEVIEMLAGLVRALQPEFVLETGTHIGMTAQAIGQALQRNGHGRLVTLEADFELAKCASARCKGLPVEVLHQSSAEYTPPCPVDLAYLDSGNIRHRLKDLLRWKDWLTGLVVIHDTAPHHPIRRDLDALEEAGVLRILFLRTPRGVCLAQFRRG